jgi:transcription initiation factor IIE alpha subunit
MKSSLSSVASIDIARPGGERSKHMSHTTIRMPADLAGQAIKISDAGEKKSIRIDEMCEKFSLSEESIRYLLSRLANKNLID